MDAIEHHVLVCIFVCAASIFYLLNYFNTRRKAEFLYQRRRRRRQVVLASILHQIKQKQKFKRRGRRSLWVYPKNLGFWETTVPLWPAHKFQRTFRISPITFNTVVRDLRNSMCGQETRLRQTISVEKRIAVAIYFLKSGADYGVVGDLFGIGKSTVQKFVMKFCNAVIDIYYSRYIKFPASDEEFKEIADQFIYLWQFPGAIGALDGTHIPMITPPVDGPDYRNYKGWMSVVLLAFVDAQYRFLYVNAGYPGSVNDGGIFEASTLRRHIMDPDKFNAAEYHIIADSAFPLMPQLLKPYNETECNRDDRVKHFSYRLSRARMVVESAFGKLKGRWRILLKRNDMKVENSVIVILTCCILHNMCEYLKETFHNDWLNKLVEFDAAFPRPDGLPVDDLQNAYRGPGQLKRRVLDLVNDTYPLPECAEFFE